MNKILDTVARAQRQAAVYGVAYIMVKADGSATTIDPVNVVLSPKYGEDCAHIWHGTVESPVAECVKCGAIGDMRHGETLDL